MKSCLNLLKLRPKYCRSLFSGHGVEEQFYLLRKIVCLKYYPENRSLVWLSSGTDGQRTNRFGISCDMPMSASTKRQQYYEQDNEAQSNLALTVSSLCQIKVHRNATPWHYFNDYLLSSLMSMFNVCCAWNYR